VPASSLEKYINLLCLCNFLKFDGSIQYLNPKPITACFQSHLNYCCTGIFTRFTILQMILLPPSLPHYLPIPFNQWVATELHETVKTPPKTSYVRRFCSGLSFCALSGSTQVCLFPQNRMNRTWFYLFYRQNKKKRFLRPPPPFYNPTTNSNP
jgi:hypothetical protein